ncbi:hypothetical protein HDU92_008667 [Lobulomyces angularis]|nr:hypothetical protein HDU92_008667 [Lobulomyces angularis]
MNSGGLTRRIKGGNRRATINKLLKSKTVAFFPGICLLINAMTGPAIPFTAQLFQSGGYVPTLLLFLLFAILSTFCCLFIVEAMQAIPGNKHFQGTVEFATLINFYFGDTAHLIGQICLYGAVQSNAVQSIALSAQGFLCVSSPSTLPSPFGETLMIFTSGFLLVLVISIPLGFLNLDDNIGIQIGAFILTVLMMLQWVIGSILVRSESISSLTLQALENNSTYSETFNDGQLDVVGKDFLGLTGNIMLSLAFTFVVPSWVNLKKKDVNTQGALWASSGISIILYIMIGIFPALAYNFTSKNNNMITPISLYGVPVILSKITTYAFPIIMLLPSIPVSFLVTQNNLVQNELTSKRMGYFLSFILPWFVSIPFISGTLLGSFINWCGVIFVSSANFIIPILIFLRCLVFRKKYNSDRTTLSSKQRKLLKLIHISSKTIRQFVDLSAFPVKKNAPEVKASVDEGEHRSNESSVGAALSDDDGIEFTKEERNEIGSLNLMGENVGKPPQFSTNSGFLRKLTELKRSPVKRSESQHHLTSRTTSEEELDLASVDDLEIDKLLEDDVPDPEEEDRIIHRQKTQKKLAEKQLEEGDGSQSKSSFAFSTLMRDKNSDIGGSKTSLISVPDDIELHQTNLTKPETVSVTEGKHDDSAAADDSLKSPISPHLIPLKRNPSNNTSSSLQPPKSNLTTEEGSSTKSRKPVSFLEEKRSKTPSLLGVEGAKDNIFPDENQDELLRKNFRFKDEDLLQEFRRKQTLPTHPLFVTSVIFRTIPTSITPYVKPRTIALICLVLCSTFTVINIVVNLINLFNPSN